MLYSLVWITLEFQINFPNNFGGSKCFFLNAQLSRSKKYIINSWGQMFKKNASCLLGTRDISLVLLELNLVVADHKNSDLSNFPSF